MIRMSEFFRDARHSIRMFWKSPGFTMAAVAALALGIGANTAIFSIVNAVLLKPLPFPQADRLIVFQQTSPQGFQQTSPQGAFSAGSPAKF
jgi:putative ABC transport system permease protein